MRSKWFLLFSPTVFNLQPSQNVTVFVFRTSVLLVAFIPYKITRLYAYKFPRALTDSESTYRSYVNIAGKYKGNIVELLLFECNFVLRD